MNQNICVVIIITICFSLNKGSEWVEYMCAKRQNCVIFQNVLKRVAFGSPKPFHVLQKKNGLGGCFFYFTCSMSTSIHSHSTFHESNGVGLLMKRNLLILLNCAVLNIPFSLYKICFSYPISNKFTSIPLE